MEKLQVLMVNCETGEETYRDLTEDEIKAAKEAEETDRLIREAKAAEELAVAQAREAAIAKLTALGLTEEEAKAIAG